MGISVLPAGEPDRGAPPRAVGDRPLRPQRGRPLVGRQPARQGAGGAPRRLRLHQAPRRALGGERQRHRARAHDRRPHHPGRHRGEPRGPSARAEDSTRRGRARRMSEPGRAIRRPSLLRRLTTALLLRGAASTSDLFERHRRPADGAAPASCCSPTRSGGSSKRRHDIDVADISIGSSVRATWRRATRSSTRSPRPGGSAPGPRSTMLLADFGTDRYHLGQFAVGLDQDDEGVDVRLRSWRRASRASSSHLRQRILDRPSSAPARRATPLLRLRRFARHRAARVRCSTETAGPAPRLASVRGR